MVNQFTRSNEQNVTTRSALEKRDSASFSKLEAFEAFHMKGKEKNKETLRSMNQTSNGSIKVSKMTLRGLYNAMHDKIKEAHIPLYSTLR